MQIEHFFIKLRNSMQLMDIIKDDCQIKPHGRRERGEGGGESTGMLDYHVKITTKSTL